MGTWISFKFIQTISDIDNSNISSLRREQLKPRTPFFTEAKLIKKIFFFIYQVSKSAFVQADSFRSWICENGRNRSWIHEYNAVYYSPRKKSPTERRKNWKICLWICKFLNIPDFKLVRWQKSCSWNRKTRPCSIVHVFLKYKYVVREFLNRTLPVGRGSYTNLKYISPV